MYYRWIGAILIIGSCSGFGISLAVHDLVESRLLRSLNLLLADMLCELPYRLTPLPELVRKSTQKTGGTLRRVLMIFAEHMDRQILPDAASCMSAALEEADISFERTKRILILLGQSLGRFDLSGQLRGLTAVQEQCAQELQAIREDQPQRSRSYRILGLCTGAALAILLI